MGLTQTHRLKMERAIFSGLQLFFDFNERGYAVNHHLRSNMTTK